MKVLVTGSNGLVGSYVVKQLLEEGDAVFASSRSADLSGFKSSGYHFIQCNFTDPYAVHTAFERIRPDVVVHSGAMSKPDDCERNQAEAYETNMAGTVQLLLNAADYKSFFIFLSTDFIFNGKEGMHKEEDAPDPLSYYGKTKREAEEAVMEYEYGWAIVRTVFVYGKPLYGRDCFLNMIAKKLQNNEPFRIVNDQERTPTFAEDLAKGISAIINKRATGIFHLSGEEVVTPYQMAMAVAGFMNIQSHRLKPVSTAELNELARRPLKSGLDVTKAKKELGYVPVSFKEGLKRTLAG
ncbi:NAD(P)-dependent oxidoreductase [Niabella ginsenosidivorans]|uniref:dTDP-4-dehydrorhamnose reductase n=1 Tax=Niabella ginsenosidivorans TaxID=1176587 RepID=A0A1A9I4E6_9BACT|nr:SDR family oxidoreductase [Niabella ginsenosidivorans]ANH81919.1 NAD(P)-dependent oxidoreductase [Niabella ginsenosidivorans]